MGCCFLCVFAVAVIKSKEDFALVMRREARTLFTSYANAISTGHKNI